MNEPLTLEVRIKVTDANGLDCVDDTFVRANLDYSDLVFIQGKLGQVGIELQKAAEAKAKGKK